MLNIGGGELLIILLVALVFLGPQRLPDVARQVGQTVSSLRSLAAGFQAEFEAASQPDHAADMKLEGPTDQAEAIASTQQGNTDTDPEVLKQAARQVNHGTSPDKPMSSGGPQTINPMDRYLGALGDPGDPGADLDNEDAAHDATADEEE